jgi:hypothetical protein
MPRPFAGLPSIWLAHQEYPTTAIKRAGYAIAIGILDSSLDMVEDREQQFRKGRCLLLQGRPGSRRIAMEQSRARRRQAIDRMQRKGPADRTRGA